MGKTITTYLIDGNPQGPQYVFISNKICKMLVIPRASLSIINERDELTNPSFYILLGEDEFQQPKAYIGETENFRIRVKDHDYKKEFWQRALIFISSVPKLQKLMFNFCNTLPLASPIKKNILSWMKIFKYLNVQIYPNIKKTA